MNVDAQYIQIHVVSKIFLRSRTNFNNNALSNVLHIPIVCTDECVNPDVPSQVIKPGEIGQGSNPCVTYHCPEQTNETECNIAERRDETCGPMKTCPDSRYELYPDNDTLHLCCIDYYCGK